MRTTVRAIGNSRGVLLPAAFIASCGIEDEVDMTIQDGQIVLAPVARVPRQGWFDNAKANDAAGADWPDATLADDGEWQW